MAMRAMAYKLFSSLKSHPLITAFSVLLLFTLPIFHMLMFFWPLMVSTALGVLAVVSFGRQSDERSTAIAECSTVPSPDIIPFPPYEEKISNVLMVGNQEVTWLEWLHNEDTQKLCAHEREPAVWDAHGCDVSSMATEAVDAPASRAEDKLNVYANGAACLDSASLRAISTEDNETSTSTVMNGFRATSKDVNMDEAKMNAPLLTVEDVTNLDSAGEHQMSRFRLTGEDETAKNVTKRNGIAFTVNEASDARAPVCAEGEEGQVSDEGLNLTGGGGKECKTVQGLLDSKMYIKDEVDVYASAGGDQVVDTVEALIVEATNECNVMANSLALTVDGESAMNKCVSAIGIEVETKAHVPVSTLEADNEVDALEYPSPTESIFRTSESKTAPTHEQDVPDLSNETIFPSLQVKGVEVQEVQHVDQQDEEERGSKQLVTHGPQWDVSDGEEDQSSLRFSFFQNSSLTASKA